MIKLSKLQKKLDYPTLSELLAEGKLKQGPFEDSASWISRVNDIGTVIIGTARFDLENADPDRCRYPIDFYFDKEIKKIVKQIPYFPDRVVLDMMPDSAENIYHADSGAIYITARVVYKDNKRQWGLRRFLLETSHWRSGIDAVEGEINNLKRADEERKRVIADDLARKREAALARQHALERQRETERARQEETLRREKRNQRLKYWLPKITIILCIVALIAIIYIYRSPILAVILWPIRHWIKSTLIVLGLFVLLGVVGSIAERL